MAYFYGLENVPRTIPDSVTDITLGTGRPMTVMFADTLRAHLSGAQAGARIRSIEVRSYWDSYEALVATLRVFGELASLTTLRLAFSGFKARQCRALSKGLGFLPQLRSLSLCHEQVGDVGMKYLARGLPRGIPRGLVCLAVTCAEVSDRGAIALARALGKLTKLESLDISGNLIEANGFRAICLGLSRAKSVRHVVLESVPSQRSNRALEKMAKCPLESVHIRRGVMCTFHWLARAGRLQSLRFEQAIVLDNIAQMGNCARMKKLCLEQCAFSEDSCVALYENILPKLRDLEEFLLGSEDAQAYMLEFTAALVNLPKLKQVRIKKVRVSPKQRRDISSLLRTSSSIYEFKLP